MSLSIPGVPDWLWRSSWGFALSQKRRRLGYMGESPLYFNFDRYESSPYACWTPFSRDSRTPPSDWINDLSEWSAENNGAPYAEDGRDGCHLQFHLKSPASFALKAVEVEYYRMGAISGSVYESGQPNGRGGGSEIPTAVQEAILGRVPANGKASVARARDLRPASEGARSGDRVIHPAVGTSHGSRLDLHLSVQATEPGWYFWRPIVTLEIKGSQYKCVVSYDGRVNGDEPFSFFWDPEVDRYIRDQDQWDPREDVPWVLGTRT